MEVGKEDGKKEGMGVGEAMGKALCRGPSELSSVQMALC